MPRLPAERATDARQMPSSPLDARRLLSAVAIVAALPSAPILVITTGSGHLALAACALLPAAVVISGPRLWPGWGRFGGLILVGPAAVAMIVGFIAGAVASYAFCTSDQTHTYVGHAGVALVLCGFAIPYALGSSWAVARPSRALWAWPLVMLASIAIGIAVLALLGGGPHHCET
jgi:hypothetical protein